jgi:hypothetical protein
MVKSVTPTVRRKLAVAFLMLLAVMIVGTMSVHKAEAVFFAGPGYCTYYSDASHTTVVGHSSNGCCGEHSQSGTITPYAVCERVYCPAVICPDAT